MDRNRWLLMPLFLSLTIGLGYTVLSLPEHTEGLQAVVSGKMEVSGVSNPVTAVLLNFRGYDTLLEMMVLLLALLGVWSLGIAPLRRETRPGPVLDTLARILVPVLILVAGYLLWIGAHAPGGAFQAGSVLGAAGVLLLLTGWRLSPRQAALPLRFALVVGPGTFLAIAVFTLLNEGRVLEYPQAQAGILILGIETAATASIGVTLAALFLGNHPSDDGKDLV
ncbi:MAG: Na(+)/H(+) antiporter subunit B [Desulforhopalus sp.]